MLFKYKSKFFYIILSCLLHIFPFTKAQSLSYTSYTTKDGLPSNIITAIFQDSKGYIWIGTNNGLCKYDGGEFTIYTTLNGLSNNWITSIMESPVNKGTIWIGTIAGGVNRLSKGNIKSFIYGEDPEWNNISDFCIDKNGTVWIIADKVFLKIVNDSVKIVQDKNAPAFPTEILIDKDGNIWCSEKNQVYIYTYSNSSWNKLNLSLNENIEIVSLIMDSENRIWAGTSDKLIIELCDSGIVRKEKTMYGISYQLQDEGHGTLLVRDRDLFFSVSKKNLSEQKLLPFPKNEEMPFDVTSPFLVDREGNIWIGTWLKGLLKVSDLSLRHFQFPRTSKLNLTNADQQGNIWVGANGGVWEVYLNNKNQWQRKFHPLLNYGKDTKIYISLIDSQNNLWLSINVKIYAYKIIKRKDQSSNLVSTNLEKLLNYINKGILLAIYPDKQNRLWFSIAESGVGVADLKNGRILKFYTIEDGIPEKDVKVIHQDRNNQIWLGGWQQGISIFSNDPIPLFKKKLTIEDGLPDNMIRSIYEDRLGNMWVGTRHNGLVRINNETAQKWIRISMKDGLSSNSIWEIIEGPENTMWVNTDAGIEQIDMQTYKVLPPKKEFLVSFEFSLSIKSFKNKRWSFTTNDELFIYEFNQRNKETVAPPIDITKILVNGNTIPFNKSLDLSYTQNNITIGFAGLSFKEERAVNYQYRLIGADTNWTTPMNHRYVSFAALNPGEYYFQVRAINSYGVISKKPASLQFTIIPPFWLRWWFIMLSTTILILIILFLYKYRVNQLLKVERLRTRIAADLHDELASNLSSIAMFGNIVEQEISDQGEKPNDLLGRIINLSQESVTSIREIIWAINPKIETIHSLFLKVSDSIVTICRAKNIKFDFDIPGEGSLPSINLTPEVRRDLWMLLKESLANSIKHSGCTELKLTASYDGKLLHIFVKDNGKGFDTSGSYAGSGLGNLKKRAEHLNAEFKMKSENGIGTAITIDLTI